jgi:hypothetical protein
MNKQPVMTAELENEGMGMAFINESTGPEADMAENNPAVYHPGQPLEAVVDVPGNVSAFCRFLHVSSGFFEIADAPTIHVLAGPHGKDGKVLWNGVIFSSRKSKQITHVASQSA